ncbi:MAG: threonine/serine dehydratase [bacterium]
MGSIELIAAEVLQAEERIRSYFRYTDLEPAPSLCHRTTTVHCKLENRQPTGSFKVRGACNKLLAMPGASRQRGVVAASTGNHGAAVAYCANLLQITSLVFVNEAAAPVKVRAIERLGALVRHAGRDAVETEAIAREYARSEDLTYVSPYNDLHVVGGQGTVGYELAQQLDQFDTVFVALGGGGLISGLAGYLKSVRPEVEIVGCSPVNSPVMIESLRAGEIVEMPSLPTLSDGTAGGVEPGAITFDLCRELVDRFVTVSEDAIAASLRSFMRAQHQLVEGAAAVALAAYRQEWDRLAGRNVVIVICGGNIDLDTLRRVLSDTPPD